MFLILDMTLLECPCWWDMSKKVCACCKKVDGVETMQCGWPMHRFCYKKSKVVRLVIILEIYLLLNTCDLAAGLSWSLQQQVHSLWERISVL